VESGESCIVRLHNRPAIQAGAVVLATNTPIHAGMSLSTRLAAYTTYAIAASIPAGSVAGGLYWDTDDPYHYIRRHIPRDSSGVEFLIVGGQDHKTGQASDPGDHWDQLEAWTRTRFPEVTEVQHRWSGQVFETLDGLALIGADLDRGENVFIATGDSGMGMTHGTIAGMLLTDLILGRSNPWVDLYAPGRTLMSATGTYLSENANVVAQYTDWVTGGDVSSVDEVLPGRGAILRQGLKKVAVYCDHQGTAHTLSAVCPHMGCVVRWNQGEQTWDCPCHGSRFAATGEVIHGPAVDDLEPTSEKES
jgi:Rieske Fe-S protein